VRNSSATLSEGWIGAVGSKRSGLDSLSNRKLLSMRRPMRQSFVGASDGTLPEALLAQDDKLSQILHEVDAMANALDGHGAGTQVLSETLRRAVSCTVKQILLDRELRSLALSDDLTGLYNRRAFLALATQQLKVARRNDQRLLLFFADIDRLKEINDTFGHGEGDRAIVRAAQSLEQTFRNSDIVARLGGDEFAVFALEASSYNANVILRRLAKSFQASNAAESRYNLSLSVGVARFDPKSPVPLGELMEQADQSMYAMKRNRPGLAASPK
jgi:diguanylate cyclase (GGDEF)-like protein